MATRFAWGHILLVTAWAGVVASGMLALGRYKATPGLSANPPSAFPTTSALTRGADRPSLILVAHPRCPCTRATLSELERLLERLDGKVEATVLFNQPAEVADAWSETDLWRRASALSGVRVVRDRGGVEAKRLGATTSGQTLLYSARGDLLFRGGLTSARGHEGQSAGSDRIADLVAGKTALSTAPVFGCALESAPFRGESER
jgi:hypothetical protein